MATKGSYDIQAMRSSANKIDDYVKNYEQQKNKMVDLVTVQHASMMTRLSEIISRNLKT